MVLKNRSNEIRSNDIRIRGELLVFKNPSRKIINGIGLSRKIGPK